LARGSVPVGTACTGASRKTVVKRGNPMGVEKTVGGGNGGGGGCRTDGMREKEEY
jgi:hypothetical protein